MPPGSRDTDRLLVFVKAPVPGTVKTRLAATLGSAAACEAYETLVRHLLRQFRGFSSVSLCFTPDDQASRIEPWLETGWQSRPQGPGDLGDRLNRAFDEAFAQGAERVIALGSDCPYVTASDVRTAFRRLGGCDTLVGPATDGGYWLLGLKRSQPALFWGIPWSTDQVLGETLRRCKEAKLKIDLMGILEDVDDLAAWQRFLSSTGAALGNA